MLKLILTLMLTASVCLAMDAVSEKSTKPSIQASKPLNIDFEHIQNQKNLNKLYLDVKTLIQEKSVSPEKITVVLDVNRTIFKKKHTVPEALDRVQDLAKLGVLLVISSANQRYDHTVRRLAKSGLAQALGIPLDHSNTFHPETIRFNSEIQLEVYRVGKVASVRMLPIKAHKFIHKAFSPFAVYGEKALQVEYVFFADDSKVNRNVFKEQTTQNHALGDKIKKVFMYEMNVD